MGLRMIALGTAMAALLLAGCQTVGSGADAGLSAVPGAYTEGQARRACMAQLGAAVRPVHPDIVARCMHSLMFGPTFEVWD